MGSRRSVFSLVVVLTLVLGLNASASTQSLEQRILPNSAADALTASLHEGSGMEVFVFSDENGTAAGLLTLSITDGRGTRAGWNVTLQSDDFLPSEGEAGAIPASGFRIVSDAGISSSIGETDGIEVINSGVPLHDGTRIVRAAEGYGTGRFTQQLEVELDIPAWQPVGTYQADMTVTIASGPGN